MDLHNERLNLCGGSAEGLAEGLTKGPAEGPAEGAAEGPAEGPAEGLRRVLWRVLRRVLRRVLWRREYQPLFGKGASATPRKEEGRPDMRELRKLRLANNF